MQGSDPLGSSYHSNPKNRIVSLGSEFLDTLVFAENVSTEILVQSGTEIPTEFHYPWQTEKWMKADWDRKLEKEPNRRTARGGQRTKECESSDWLPHAIIGHFRRSLRTDRYHYSFSAEEQTVALWKGAEGDLLPK